MIIGIEASRANRTHKTGVEWYSHNVIQYMKQLPDAEKHSWLLYSNNPLCFGLERGPSNWHERRLVWPPKYLWTQIRLSYEMYFRPPEVLFIPAHVQPRISPKRTVVTIHDVGFHRYPELYKPRHVAYHEVATRDIVKNVPRIITVSEFTKQELVDLYHADPNKIHVTHLGIDDAIYMPSDHTEIEAVCERLHIVRPYLLYVGRLELKKNVMTVFEAFRRYKEARGLGDPLSLVFAGLPGIGMDKLEETYHESKLGDSVHFTGYISEAEKVALYSGATALVHPSWYEGFGLTPLEAMACGCPVICSNAASLPEVVGMGNALFFDPANIDSCMQRIMQVIDDDPEIEEIRKRGFEWVKKYRWDKTAQQTLDVLTKW